MAHHDHNAVNPHRSFNDIPSVFTQRVMLDIFELPTGRFSSYLGQNSKASGRDANMAIGDSDLLECQLFPDDHHIGTIATDEKAQPPMRSQLGHAMPVAALQLE